MKKYFFCAALFASLLAGGCSKSSENSFVEPQKPVTPEVEKPIFTAETECESDTRTSLGADRYILWSKGDVISVFPKSTLSVDYILQEGAGTHRGTFASDPDGLPNFGGEVIDHNLAVYPSGNVSLVKDATGYKFGGIVLPKDQYYVANSLPAEIEGSTNACMPMVAVSSTENFAFKNVGAAIKFQLKSGDIENHKLSKIVLEARTANDAGVSDVALAGTCEVKIGQDGLNPAISAMTGTATSITLHLPQTALTKTEPTTIYMVIPPMTFEHGFKIDIYDNRDNTMTLKSKKAIVGRNQILSMPVIAYKAGTWGSIDDIIIQNN